MGGLFSCIGPIVPETCSRLGSCLHNIFKGFRTNRGQMYSRQSSEDHLNTGLMLYAGDLEVKHIKNKKSWILVDQSESEPRFTKVGNLSNASLLEIQARINFTRLSPETKYAAHLIFKTTSISEGLDTLLEASVSVASNRWRKDVWLKPTEATPHNKYIGLPTERTDGWLQLELGQFYCEEVTHSKEVVVSIKDTDDKNKISGLIIAGIEVLRTGLMIFARASEIKHIKDDKCWIWVQQSETRFEEAACLLNVSWLEIKAKINFHKLSAKTKYGAHLIFRTKPDSKGLGTIQKASVFMGKEKWTRNVCLRPTEEAPNGPQRGMDGWSWSWGSFTVKMLPVIRRRW